MKDNHLMIEAREPSEIYSGLKILVIDDEPGQLEILTDILRDAGYDVMPAAGGEEGLKYLFGGDCLLLLTDLKMPGMDGLEVLRRALNFDPRIQVVLMTAFGTIPSAVNAIKNGAYDYLTKPFKKEELLQVLKRAAEKVALIRENQQLKDEIAREYGFENLIGESAAMREIFRQIEKVKNADATVLITGESGTGKELVARAIHFNGHRRNGPFVALNCGAIPESLIESELFGYEKGAFTGAVRSTPGKFEMAQPGTILLDEIGVMPAHLQTRLLRVLQNKTVSRIGGKKEIALNVRIVAATNENLLQKIKTGEFREDLYHRLNLIAIHLPPLRSRKKDIPRLAGHFLKKISRRYQRHNLQLTPAALDKLEGYHFPGNVRELENILEKTVLMAEGSLIDGDMLLFTDRPDDGKQEGEEMTTLPSMEKVMIREALETCQGSIKRAALQLGISYKTLQYRMKKFGLDKKDFR